MNMKVAYTVNRYKPIDVIYTPFLQNIKIINIATDQRKVP
jgi:hypothetical protein